MILIWTTITGWNEFYCTNKRNDILPMNKTIIRTLIIFSLLFGPLVSSAGAQNKVKIINQSVEYEFGGLLNFQIDYETTVGLESLILFVQASGIPTFVGAVSLESDGLGYFTYDLSNRPLPALSNVNYYYRFTLSNGEVVDSPIYQFTYLDNRFNWQELNEGPFKIYWYEGGITLAQDVVDAAVEGQTKILELLQQPPDNQPITIFIYSSEEDLSASLSSIGQNWVGGQADPDKGSLVVALPQAIDQPLEIQRLIPHELAHIYLYRFMGVEYDYLPAWFNEGLASQMEAYNLPEYDLILERAASGNGLIPMVHLCQAFPVDPDLAMQSYAQANSLVDYIQRQYGLPAVQALILAYDQGLSCERGVEAALNMTLVDLDEEWQRATFGGEIRSQLIYILVALLLVLLAGLALFIYSRMRVGSKDEWNVEGEPLPDADTGSKFSREDYDFRMGLDED